MGSLTQGQDRFHNTLIVEQMIQLKESTTFIIGKYGAMASRARFSSILSISKIDISLSLCLSSSLICYFVLKNASTPLRATLPASWGF